MANESGAWAWLGQHPWSGRVRLLPRALSGRGLAADHVWLVEPAVDGTIRLSNCSTGHFVHLTPGDVVSVSSDPTKPKDGLAYAVLETFRRLALDGAAVRWRPARRLPLSGKPRWRRT